MKDTNAVVAVYDTHAAAEDAVKELQKSGFDVKKLSVVGKDYHTDEQVVGYYNVGDRMKYWGKRGAFWGGFWGLLFGAAFFWVPAIGPVLVGGPLMASIIAALEDALVVGGLSAIGDGTENPRGEAVIDAVMVGEEDAAFVGGSYVIVQKYLHDLNGWNALSTEVQERIIGRTKLSDIELDESIKPTSAHNALTTIVEDGKEIKILRDNMPFGRPGHGEFGTYFIGYSRSPRTIEQMLENMFVGRPPGNYDRLLDFSRAVTGNTFFAPSATFLEAVGDDQSVTVASPLAVDPATAAGSLSSPRPSDGSLGVGSLKGEFPHE